MSRYHTNILVAACAMACATLGVVAVSRADIPPPPIRYGAGHDKLADKLFAFHEKSGVTRLKYTPAAERVSIVVPKQRVPDVTRAGLMEFAEDKAPSETAVSGIGGPMQHIAVGIALALMFVTAGIWLFRAKFSPMGLVVFALGAGLVVLGAGSVFLISELWKHRNATEATSVIRPQWPKRNSLDADVTVIDEGAFIEIIIPESLKPPPRTPRDRWPDKFKDK